jgi:3-hydroxyisobutyrate dehydrogenase
MGSNMARRLKEKGFRIIAVYDTRADIAESLAKELGAEATPFLARVADLSDIVITVVTDDAAMRKIYATKGDSLLKSAKDRIFINCATVSPKIHMEVEQVVQKNGGKSLEACMASSITQAKEGTLYLMCGGDETVFQEVKPILDALSKTARFAGKAGDAAKIKALVNMVMNINTAGLAEGLGLGSALGLDLKILREIFSQTGANSRVLETDGADMENREHECYFSSAHAAKDSGIALNLAKELGLTLPLAKATKQQYDRMVELGLGELDKSGIAELTFPGRTPLEKQASEKH